MRDQSRRFECRQCNRLRNDDELFSYRGLCRDCGLANLEAGMKGDKFTDPNYVREYRKGVAASVGAILLEDIPALVEEHIARRIKEIQSGNRKSS